MYQFIGVFIVKFTAMKPGICILIGSVFLLNCSNTPKPLSESEKAYYQTLGDSITTETQKILLHNVSTKIKEKGIVSTVDFCNENAISLTHSLSEGTNFQINRISLKNRNEKNALSNEIDRKAWEEILKLMEEPTQYKHIVLSGENNSKVYYYKAIPLGMPICLACHGNKQTEIEADVLQAINSKYPTDKATDYKMGELRGLWKMEFERK